MRRGLLLGAVSLRLALAPTAQGQNDGTLWIQYPDLESGEAALAITPRGVVVAFDAGPAGEPCERLIEAYVEVGVTAIDYLVVSHYADDTIGCVPELVARFPVRGAVFDRGGLDRTPTFRAYDRALGEHRRRVRPGRSVVVDAASRFDPDPVLLQFAAVNGRVKGDRLRIPRRDQEARGLVTKLSYGRFEALFGGAIAGTDEGSEFDIEALAGPAVGEIEVYTAHREGSAASSSARWLDTVTPQVAILAIDEHDDEPLPAPETMARLHARGVRTYWTNPGNGASPDARFDRICGDIYVTFELATDEFRVSCAGRAAGHVLGNDPTDDEGDEPGDDGGGAGGDDGSGGGDDGSGGGGDGSAGGDGGSGGDDGSGGGDGNSGGGGSDGGSGGGDSGSGGGDGGSGGGGDDDAEREPLLKLAVDGKATPEIATLHNDGDSSVDLSGWTLVSLNGDESYEFPLSLILLPGTQIQVVSGPGGLTIAGALIWSADAVWDDHGDRARLIGADGDIVLEVDVH